MLGLFFVGVLVMMGSGVLFMFFQRLHQSSIGIVSVGATGAGGTMFHILDVNAINLWQLQEQEQSMQTFTDSRWDEQILNEMQDDMMMGVNCFDTF